MNEEMKIRSDKQIMSLDETTEQTRKKYIEDFYKKIADKDENGCMKFLGKINKTGHGVAQLTRDGEIIIGSHRVVYYLKYGYINRNLYMNHTCCNRDCCNTDHLFQDQNIGYMGGKRRKII